MLLLVKRLFRFLHLVNKLEILELRAFLSTKKRFLKFSTLSATDFNLLSWALTNVFNWTFSASLLLTSSHLFSRTFKSVLIELACRLRISISLVREESLTLSPRISSCWSSISLFCAILSLSIRSLNLEVSYLSSNLATILLRANCSFSSCTSSISNLFSSSFWDKMCKAAFLFFSKCSSAVLLASNSLRMIQTSS